LGRGFATRCASVGGRGQRIPDAPKLTIGKRDVWGGKVETTSKYLKDTRKRKDNQKK